MPAPSLAATIWENASRLAGFPPGQLAGVRDMVKRTGLPLGNLQRIHDGGNPTVQTVADLAHALRVDAHQLLQPATASGHPAAEPPMPYSVKTDAALLDGLAELVRRVPPETRPAFADIVAGWINSGDASSRTTALLALLQLTPKQQNAA